MKRQAIALGLLSVAVACTNTNECAVVTHSEPPHDMWQLAKRAIDAVPLNVDKMNALTGVSMAQDPQTPVRWEGERSVLAPGLTLTGSVLGMKVTWTSATLDIEPNPCVSQEEVNQPSIPPPNRPGESTAAFCVSGPELGQVLTYTPARMCAPCGERTSVSSSSSSSSWPRSKWLE
jgi:hypothetical protein